MAEAREDAVRRTLRSMLDDVGVEVPSIEPVFRRGRRRRAAARVSVAVAAVLIGLAVLVPLRVLQEGNLSSPAAEGDTYVLSNFQISASGEPGTARVSFHSAWTGPTYPGRATCAVRLLDEHGEVVGHKQLMLVALQPEGGDGPMSVNVSSMPASATGSCGPAEPPTRAYRISHLRVASPGTPFGGADLTGTVNWPGKQPPGANACTVVLRTPGEPTEVRHVSVVISSQKDLGHEVNFAENIGDARPIGVVCEPFTRPDDFPVIPGVGPTRSPTPPPGTIGRTSGTSITVSVFNATTTPEVASDAARALADAGYLPNQKPANSPQMLGVSRVYYRRIPLEDAKAMAEGLFGSLPYRLLSWDASSPLLADAGESDAAVFIGKTALGAGRG